MGIFARSFWGFPLDEIHRVATQLNIEGHQDTGYETVNTYYYHPDHLGSSQLVSDYQGKEYQRVEYTPYGESWIDKESDSFKRIPYKFTGKELDSETGLYYYGARYLDPRTSRWASADPALGDYVPEAPTSDEARKRNQNLPGMGGVFNLVNLAVFHYSGNNPVKFKDPTGAEDLVATFNKDTNTMTATLVLATGVTLTRTWNATNNVQQPATPANTFTNPKDGGQRKNYYPQSFPNGTWNLEQSSVRSDGTFGFAYVGTDAWQTVDTYSRVIDPNIGNLVWQATGKQKDAAYGIHSTGSNDLRTFTNGCILMSNDDLIEFTGWVDIAKESGGKAQLRVVGSE